MSESQTTTFKVICQGGLNSNQNHLDLSENRRGWATRLLNFEPSLFGGYRRINGYIPLDSNNMEVDPDNSEGPILGIALFNSDVIVARKQKGSPLYSFYRWGQGSPWIKYDTPGLSLNSFGVNRLRHVTFNFDGTNKIIFVDGINNAAIFDGVSWSQINTTNTGATDASPGGDQTLNAPKYVTVFKNHVFISGDESYTNVVAHSAPNAEYDWTVANGAGQLNAGFPVVQLRPFRDENFVFGILGIKKISVSGETFTIHDVVKDIGCIASDSVLEVAGDLVYLSQDGMRTIAGTDKIGDVELSTVSKPIQQTLTSLANNYSLDSVSSVLIRSKSQFRIFFNRAESTSLDTKGILGGLIESQEGINWEWAELRGISAPVVTSGYLDKTEYIIHGDYNGNVFRQELGNSFNGDPILAIYETPFLDFGDTEIRKTLRTATVFLRSEGTSIFDLNVKYDWDVYGTLNPDRYFFNEENLLSWYGEAVYGVSRYSDVSSPIFKTNIEGSSFSTRLIISSAAVSDPFSIQGIVFQLSPNDRK